MKYRAWLILLIALHVGAASAECECPTRSVEQSILEARHVFYGKVVSASLSDSGTPGIAFLVNVVDVIRGTPDRQYRLTTPLPDSCGIAVRLGFTEMFVLAPNSTSVSRCNGSGRATYMEYPLLATAIKLVDLPESDAVAAQRLLRKELYASFDRALMDEFFDLVENIDPSGSATSRSVHRIRYRGIDVLFSDGKYLDVQVH